MQTYGKNGKNCQVAPLISRDSNYFPLHSTISPVIVVLGAAGTNNPFLENYDASGSRIEAGGADQSQYYGAGYSQAQSGYSSSGFGKIKGLPHFVQC